MLCVLLFLLLFFANEGSQKAVFSLSYNLGFYAYTGHPAMPRPLILSPSHEHQTVAPEIKEVVPLCFAWCVVCERRSFNSTVQVHVIRKCTGKFQMLSSSAGVSRHPHAEPSGVHSKFMCRCTAVWREPERQLGSRSGEILDVIFQQSYAASVCQNMLALSVLRMFIICTGRSRCTNLCVFSGSRATRSSLSSNMT